MRLTSPLASAALALVLTQVQAQEQGIPSDASAGCKSFIDVFNQNSDFSQCTDPLLAAVTQYTKATSQKGATPVSDANALSTALDALCTPGAGCSAATMKGIVRNFALNCLPDLVAPKPDVVALYDKLYLITPFQNALCSKDDHDKYCVTSLAESGQVGNETKRSLPQDETPFQKLARGVDELTELHNQLVDRATDDSTSSYEISDKDDGSAEIIMSDGSSSTSQAASTNLQFLFIQPDSDKSILCGTCAQKILASYIQYETSIPYAIGLANSDVLKTQSPLYKAGQKTCGDSWAKKVNSLAGTSAFAEVSPASVLQRPTWWTGGLAAATIVLALV